MKCCPFGPLLAILKSMKKCPPLTSHTVIQQLMKPPWLAKHLEKNYNCMTFEREMSSQYEYPVGITKALLLKVISKLLSHTWVGTDLVPTAEEGKHSLLFCIAVHTWNGMNRTLSLCDANSRSVIGVFLCMSYLLVDQQNGGKNCARWHCHCGEIRRSIRYLVPSLVYEPVVCGTCCETGLWIREKQQSYYATERKKRFCPANSVEMHLCGFVATDSAKELKQNTRRKFNRKKASSLEIFWRNENAILVATGNEVAFQTVNFFRILLQKRESKESDQ